MDKYLYLLLISHSSPLPRKCSGPGQPHIEMGVLKVTSMIFSTSQCCTYEIPVHVVVTATMFHQCSVHVNLATEIVGLVCQSEASVVHHLHNLRFVSSAGRLAGGQRLDKSPWNRPTLPALRQQIPSFEITPNHSCNPPHTTQAHIQ